MADTFTSFKPLEDLFLLSEHKASSDFTLATHTEGAPDKAHFVSPALLRMLASPKEPPSAGRPGQP